LSWLG